MFSLLLFFRREGVLFNDAGTFRQDGTIEVISGNGFEGNNEGRAENSSFGQPMGICTENSDVFVTDAQTETYSHNAQ